MRVVVSVCVTCAVSGDSNAHGVRHKRCLPPPPPAAIPDLRPDDANAVPFQGIRPGMLDQRIYLQQTTRIWNASVHSDNFKISDMITIIEVCLSSEVE